jgi:hypothetical protein
MSETLKMGSLTDPPVYYTTTSPEQQETGRAVIEAAVAWAQQTPCTSRVVETDLKIKALAYVAATRPQGKRPEEVEPGTRFRFERGPNVFDQWDPEQRCCLKMLALSPYWHMEGGHRLYGFTFEDRIIPINPGQD